MIAQARPSTRLDQSLRRARSARSLTSRVSRIRPTQARAAAWLAAGAIVVAALAVGRPAAPASEAPLFGARSEVGAAAEPIGGRSEASALTPDPLDLALKGVLVGSLLYLTLRTLRRVQSGGSGAGSELVVLESRSLPSRASVHLIAVGDRRLLVGVSQGSIAPLADLGPLDAR
jgi:hypothetical protein